MQITRIFYLLLLPALGVAGVFIFGLFGLLSSSFSVEGAPSLGNYESFFSRKDLVDTLIYTHEVAFLTTVFSLLIGYPLAAYIARYNGNRNHLMFLVILPWLVSIVVRTYGWMVVLGPRGLINSFLMEIGIIKSPVLLMFNTTGVVVGLMHIFLPFMVLSILTVFLQIDKRLEEAAMNLGANPLHVFWKITLPLTVPGILSGIVIVYLMSTGAIVTPLLLGGLQNKMLGTQIYQDIAQVFDYERAATMGFLLVATSFLFILPIYLFERRFMRSYGG